MEKVAQKDKQEMGAERDCNFSIKCQSPLGMGAKEGSLQGRIPVPTKPHKEN